MSISNIPTPAVIAKSAALREAARVEATDEELRAIVKGSDVAAANLAWSRLQARQHAYES